MSDEPAPKKRKRKAKYPKGTPAAKGAAVQNQLKRQQRQLRALELIAQGYTYAAAAKEVGVGVVCIWDYVKDATNIYRERIAESVEHLIAFEWARLEQQETKIWNLIRSAETDAVSKEGGRDYKSIATLYARLQALNKDRLSLIEKIDPGADQSLDTTVSLVVVRDRTQLPKIIEATEFAQRVIQDEFPSQRDEEEQPAGD